MTRVNDAVVSRPPDVARMVTVVVPGAAVPETVRSIRAVDVAPESCAGFMVALTPLGEPEMVSDTSPLNPPPRVSVTEMKLVAYNRR